MTRFAIVRHGQTDWNLEKRIQGSTDIPLNSIGRAQAAETGLALRGTHWDAIVTSPLTRAHETARIIAGELDRPAPLVVPELTERHHGEIEGLTFAERQLRFPDGSKVPGLETRQAVLDRVLPALELLALTYPDRQIVVVCHGGVIGTLVRYATGGKRPAAGELIPNGSVHDFRWQDGRLELEAFQPVR
ncbi:histidine phosphatase family protein [Cryobacterium sp. SO2]|uniref:histidine phosphatase family protein n=1 Tax=Cryobacterium sp. SO2 TaxID=1897060 RepID=UPI00223DD2E0|nr:histidine phosphatase family protein [Cryobacterium sp. SO2]WEO79222.1 histidine phosphatase family protein [Cryobacterium sp. SO2]